MSNTRVTQAGLVIGIGVGLGLGLAAPAQATGPITFGAIPAVAYNKQATDAGAAGRGKAESQEQMPGYSRAIMAPVTSDESDKVVMGRKPGHLNVNVPRRSADSTAPIRAQRVSGDAAATGPASIPELARALRNDPDLIYEYVRNNIEYVPTWGILKGDFGTLLDNQGTAFDQAALMVALLRQSGYTASFVKGRLSLTAAQIRDWVGVDTTNVCSVLNLFGGAQIPISSIVATAAGSCPGSTAALYSMKVDHVWVKVNINGTNYFFDPSYKPHTRKTGINLASATGYSAAGFMSSATSGATITADYVQGINRANARSNLTNYATNLARYLRTNLPAATLDDVVGGMTITPHNGAKLRQTVLPYQDTAVALTEWTTDVPANFKPTLRVQYQGIDRTFTSDAIYGRRLTLTYNTSSQPVLSLDGTVLATGTAVAAGSYGNVNMTVTHGAYTSTFANQSFAQQIKAGGTYVISNGWGPGGRGPIELHRSRLDQALASGASATSEAALGSSLAVLSSSWIGQTNHSNYITDRLARTNTLLHHQVGIAGYNTAAYVDLPGNMVSVVSQDASTAKEAAVFFSSAMHSSIFESTAVQQTTGGSAVSTVKLIDMAVLGGQRIYDAKSSNFAGAVQPNLVNCSPYIASFQNSVNAGRRLILPNRCDQNENGWTGVGFFDIMVSSAGSSIGSIISGNLAGGFSTSPLSPSLTNTNSFSSSISPKTLTPYTGATFGDPVDMTTGHFLYQNDDITAGAGEFPANLTFTRSYSSSARTQRGTLGNGWTSNLNGRINVGSDGFQGMGEDSPVDAVAAIAEKLVSIDLLSDTAKPVTNMVLATLGQRWFGEQITNNTVVVKQGLNGEVFVRLPDGSFNSPQGNSARLVKNADGTYRYSTVNMAALDFDAAGKIVTYTTPSGIQAKFVYTNDLLTQVSNSFGRALTLTYVSGRISSLSDGFRSVSYTYDVNGDLTAFNNALTAPSAYQYDIPGRLAKIFYPTNPSVAFVSNVYDTLGRVQSQTNAYGKNYDYYFAGSRSEEVGPFGQSKVSYLDAQGKVLKSVNPSGRVMEHSYDGQGRVIKTVLPEGGQTTYEYDDASCAAQMRCTHNVKTIRQIPKPGRTEPVLVNSFTYESSFNKVATATDPNLKQTTYTYTPQGNLQTVSHPANAQGVQGGSSYGYSSYSVAGFPVFYLQTSITDKVDAGTSIVTTTSYDAANKFVQKTLTKDSGDGKLNLTTSYVYDSVGNLTEIDRPRTDVSDVIRMSFDAERRLLQTSDPLGKLSKNAYNADGKLVRTAEQAGTQWLVTCTSYDVGGRVVRNWGPSLTTSDTVCPVASAPVTVQDFEYDDLGRNIRITESLPAAEGGNRIEDKVYNIDNSLKSISRAVGSDVAQVFATYAYSPDGQLLTVKDAKGSLTTYVYDGHNRKVQTLYPDKTAVNQSSSTDYEQYGYDVSGNLITHRRRDGQTITTSYDALGRVIGRTYPNAADNTVFTYDLLSRMLSARYANGSFEVSSTYDNAGRVTSTGTGGKTLGFVYDAAGNRVRTTWPEATPFFVTTSYDALNRPLGVFEMGTTSLASYAYDDLSRRTAVTLGNGTSTTYGYSNQGNLASLTHNLAGAAQDNTWNYVRNQAQEIASHTWSNDSYQWTGYKNGTQSYTSNGLDQYSAVGGTSLAYDGNGNLSSDGVSTFGYDSENRLRSVANANLSATLAYDALGRLRQSAVGANTTNLLYAGSQLVAEYDGAGSLLRRYVHGENVDEPLISYEGGSTANKSWLYADHLGSIVATAPATGTASTLYTYGPFGEPDVSAGVRFRFTGQQYLSDLGLSYFKARFYSPSLGRFLQTDPVGHTDELNLHTYVNNDPINATDPSGETPMHLAAAFVGGVGGVLFQAGSDLVSWKLSSRGDYAGALVGGAAGGAAAVTCGPACAGAVGGAASSITRQLVNGGGVSAAAVGRDTVYGTIGGGIGGKVIPQLGKAYLSTGTKGSIGEGLSYLGLKLAGNTNVAKQVPNGVGKSTFDFQLTSGKYIESKFGTAGLSTAQRKAAKLPGTDLEVHYWDYDTVSGMIGAAAGAAGAGGASGKGK